MDTNMMIILSLFAVLVGLIAWFMLRLIKRSKKKRMIPPELLAELTEIERRYIQDGKSNPYETLWNYTREKHLPRGIGTDTESNKPTGVQAINEQRDGVQNGTDSINQQSSNISSKPNKQVRRNIFSKFARRKSSI
jgi:hypothetical protein